MPTDRRRYAKALEDISKRYSRLDDETVRRLIALLQDTRRGIASQLLNNPTDFETFRLGQLRASVEQVIGEFQINLGRSLQTSFSDATGLGSASVIEPLEAIGIRGRFNAISPQLVNTAVDFSAMLVQNISNDLRGSIDTQLRLAVLAQQSPAEAMKNITKALGVKASDGVWGKRKRPESVKGVAARSETIVRTEMTRVFNLATNSQQREAAEVIPGLKKRWIATGDERTRSSHIAAHQETAAEPIPIDEPFNVGGSSLMFPGDPAGAPEETINCRCTVVTVHPDVELIKTPTDTKVDKIATANDAKPARKPAPAFTPEYHMRLEEHAANKAFADEYLKDEDFEDYKQLVHESDELVRKEADLSAAAQQFGYDPANMTKEKWLALSQDLEEDTGRLLKFSTEARRVGIGNKGRGQADFIAQVGGQDRAVRGGSVTAADAKRIAADLNRQSIERSNEYLGGRLTRLGYSGSDVKALNFEQKRRALAEIGNGELQRANIGKLSKSQRLEVINNAAKDQRIDAFAAAKSPRTVEGLDRWELYRDATERAGIVDPPYVPDELWGDDSESIPKYLQRGN